VRLWVAFVLLVSTACTDRDTSTGHVAESADFLPTLDSSLAATTQEDTLADVGPRLVLRCDGGHLGAYIVTDESTGTGEIGSDAVEVRLDSAPSC
jgi:hypothetical protein